ncbi:MAG: hypothetical protein ACOZDY_17595 [Pseudomonadota bacterium]
MIRTLALPLVAALIVLGCAQSHPTLRHRAIDLAPGALETYGIAFITPSTVTGQEEEKQAVALTFAEVLKRDRPKVRVATLAETLGAVNRAGLAEEYRTMYADYRDTGLFKRDTLMKVGDLVGTRYVAQLKLQAFDQGEKERFGVLGLRLLETKTATVRLFFQIWDAGNGTIVWEGINELRISTETMAEEPVTLTRVIERAAEDLVARLP